MKFTIGFSPCPNDTFIFDALVQGKIDLEGLEFEPIMADVEELNRRAFQSNLDITKLSYHALGWLLGSYALLNSGSAMGNNCGPLLIARKPLSPEEIEAGSIAIPGKYTTANLLFSLAYPGATDKHEMLFSEIEHAVQSGIVTAGLIIHENRFTYQSRGLVKIMDLGEYWESNYNAPIPLGGIAIKRSIKPAIAEKVDRVIRKSVEFALKNPESSRNFVKCHAQEMEEKIMHQHISLYVNDFTVNLGEAGRSAVNRLFQEAINLKIIPSYDGQILIN